MIGSYHATSYGAPSLDKAQSKYEKYAQRAAEGKRCGFPPSRARCNVLAEKWRRQVETLQLQDQSFQAMTQTLSPEASANAIHQAAGAEVAAIQAESNTTAYIAAGVVVLGAVATAAVLLLRG